MRIALAALVFAVTIGGLFLFDTTETQKKSENTENYAQIIKNLNQTISPAALPSLISQPTKTLIKTGQLTKRPLATATATPSPTVSGSPAPTPSTTTHIYYTSSSSRAKYYYCDSDSGWKNLSRANLKQFSSPEELLRSYPNRILHEPCK